MATKRRMRGNCAVKMLSMRAHSRLSGIIMNCGFYTMIRLPVPVLSFQSVHARARARARAILPACCAGCSYCNLPLSMLVQHLVSEAALCMVLRDGGLACRLMVA
jgi:hypothetical protein